MTAHAQVVPADAAAVFVGKEHFLPKSGIAAVLRLHRDGRVLRIEAQPDGIEHVLPDALRKMAIHNAAGDFRGIRGEEKRRYIAAIQAAMTRDYAPIAGIFRAVIARTLRSQARALGG